jgi:serine/threonine protein kinase
MRPVGLIEVQVGSLIGRYRLVERIGGGVMTHVFTAYDEGADQTVALKFIAAEVQNEPEIRERFYREARITAEIRHPNIVSVLDVGEDAGRRFIVMELLKGLPLTPSNCFVQDDGVLKILDFGLARLQASTLTAIGAVVGTPAFMAPEQAEGRQVDVRSDIFSAAAVAYFMLSGRALQALLYDDPAPISEIPVPDQLRRVLSRAMAKSPDDRYQHCAQALTDLTDVRRLLEPSPGSGSGVPGSFHGHAPELRRRIAAFAGMVGL